MQFSDRIIISRCLTVHEVYSKCEVAFTIPLTDLLLSPLQSPVDTATP